MQPIYNAIGDLIIFGGIPAVILTACALVLRVRPTIVKDIAEPIATAKALNELADHAYSSSQSLKIIADAARLRNPWGFNPNDLPPGPTFGSGL